MTKALGDFIRALRAADVRISPSEAIDAGATLALLGYEDRATLKTGLAQALAKSAPEKEIFERAFDAFFTFTPIAAQRQEPRDDAQSGEPQSSQPDEQDEPGDGCQQEQEQGTGGEGGTSGNPAERGLIELLESGDRAELAIRLADAAQRVAVNDIRLFTQRGLYTLRILERMGVDDLDDAIARGDRSGDEGERARAQRLREAREGLRLDVRDLVEQQLALFAANTGRNLREEILSTVRLSNIERSDMALMHALVTKMAKRLVTLHSRRRRIARRGHLDVRRTIRANVEFDGIPFKTIWKRRKIDRPDIIALCDVSGSVSQVSQFLLMFLYALHDILPSVRSFAFSGKLGEVSDIFRDNPIEQAMAETLSLYGGSTDYGEAFEIFERLALEDVDHRTTVIVLGDARANNANPRADILRKIHERARRVIFLNPEPRSRWNTGDSVMSRYEPACDRAMTCASLRDLERVVSDLMRTAA